MLHVLLSIADIVPDAAAINIGPGIATIGLSKGKIPDKAQKVLFNMTQVSR